MVSAVDIFHDTGVDKRFMASVDDCGDYCGDYCVSVCRLYSYDIGDTGDCLVCDCVLDGYDDGSRGSFVPDGSEEALAEAWVSDYVSKDRKFLGVCDSGSILLWWIF